jgi:hypothetical protein
MTKTIKTAKTSLQTIQNIHSRKLTNNTQRVGLRLLTAAGEWIPRSQLARIPSATARVRDLRKEQFGSLQVECRSSDDLKKKTSKRTFYYRINASRVTKKQLDKLFPTV